MSSDLHHANTEFNQFSIPAGSASAGAAAAVEGELECSKR